jgi:hypothetical protein
MNREILTRGSTMDALQAFLEELKRLKVADHHFLGLLHILIGRKVARDDGTVVSNGMTWRQLSAVLKKARWNKEHAKKLGLEVEGLAPRDRERMWYLAISRAGVDSEEARRDGDKVAEIMNQHGWIVGSAPGQKD